MNKPDQERPQIKQVETASDSHSNLVPGWAWTAAIALLLIAAFTTWQMQRSTGEFALLHRRAAEEAQRGKALQSEQLRYQQALDIIAARATKDFQLLPARAALGSPPAQSRANENIPAVTAYWNPKMGLVLSADKMPRTPAGRTLQLWIVPRAGAPASAGIFRSNASGQVLMVMPPISAMNAAKSLEISDEPAGGSPQPTTASEWSGSLP